MSIFKSREWWEVNLDGTQIYDSRCLLLLTLKNEEYQSILIGNHEGVLRLFSPHSEVVDGVVAGFNFNHLLLEIQLPFPILQINEGALVSGVYEKQLAVLHPKLFSVYVIKKSEIKENNFIQQVEIELSYQHVLRHSAHSFVLGSFGGVRGRHFICIQSLDGLFSFYEQENFAFQLHHPNFLLPFNFTYLDAIDSFLFCNGFLTLECYSYETLASSANSKKMIATWNYRLGEIIKDIQIVNKDGLIIIILVEKNLYGFNENGTLIFSKYLGYKPISFLAYLTAEEKKLITIIASEGQSLNLYDETTLKWSLKINLTPISIKKIFLNQLPGGLLLLSENGLLQCIYLGTHPSIYLIPPLQVDHLNLPKLEAELKVMQEKIASDDKMDPLMADLITVDIEIDKVLKELDGIRMCNLTIEIRGECGIRSLQAMIVVEPPLIVTEPSYFIYNFSETVFFDTTIFLGKKGIPSSLNVQIIITYVTNEGLGGYVRKECVLPTSLVIMKALPLQEPQHKLIISINKHICGMDQLFKDFFKEGEIPNMISLKYLNSENVITILAAKTTQRYRLQSDSLPHISLLLLLLIQRLNHQFLKDFDFSLNCSSSLPLETYFEKIEIFHKCILYKQFLEKKLAKETSQYRLVQKKILSNFKDVSKSGSNLYEVLLDTSKRISNTTDELKNFELQLMILTTEISSLSRMIIMLLELTNIGKKDLRLIRIVLNPYVNDTVDNQGWLEYQEAASSFFLRTLLAKSLKETQKSSEIILQPLKDTARLIKHTSSVLERVTKSSYLMEQNKLTSKKENLHETAAVSQKTDKNFNSNISTEVEFPLSITDEYTDKESTIDNLNYSEQLTITEKDYSNDSKIETKILQESEASLIKMEIKNDEIKREDNLEESSEETCDDSIWDVKIDEMIV